VRRALAVPLALVAVRGEFRFGDLPAGRYAIDSSRGGDPTAVLEDMPPEMAAMMRDALAQRAREAPPTTQTVTVDAAAGDEAAVTLVQNFPAAWKSARPRKSTSRARRRRRAST
jgi:hypothetical protein